MNEHVDEKKTQPDGPSYLKQKLHVRKGDLCILVFGTIGVHLLANLLFKDAGRWFSWLADGGGAALSFCTYWSLLITNRKLPSDSSPTDASSGIPDSTPPEDE